MFNLILTLTQLKNGNRLLVCTVNFCYDYDHILRACVYDSSPAYQPVSPFTASLCLCTVFVAIFVSCITKYLTTDL